MSHGSAIGLSATDALGRAALCLHFPSEREAIHASILKSRLDLQRLQSDLHDTISLSREMISQSLDLIAKVDEALANNLFLVPPRY